MPLNETILDAVGNANFKTNAEMATQSMTGHHTRLQILAEKALAKSLESMDTIQVSEGLGISAAQRGDLAKQVSELGAAVAGLQQLMKGAQTTPPPTHGT